MSKICKDLLICVPAAAVIRKVQVFPGMINGVKGV